jgi:hypothetical protein
MQERAVLVLSRSWLVNGRGMTNCDVVWYLTIGIHMPASQLSFSRHAPRHASISHAFGFLVTACVSTNPAADDGGWQ